MSFRWVWFSCSVVSDSLQPQGLQQATLPHPSPTRGPCSNLCPLCQWCHPTISSSVLPFLYLQSFLASGSFPMNRFFTSSDQSIGASVSASVLPMNIQDWFLLGLIGLSLCSPWGSQESSPQFKSINSSALSFCYSPTLSHIHTWLLEKP